MMLADLAVSQRGFLESIDSAELDMKGASTYESVEALERLAPGVAVVCESFHAWGSFGCGLYAMRIGDAATFLDCTECLLESGAVDQHQRGVEPIGRKSSDHAANVAASPIHSGIGSEAPDQIHAVRTGRNCQDLG